MPRDLCDVHSYICETRCRPVGCNSSGGSIKPPGCRPHTDCKLPYCRSYKERSSPNRDFGEQPQNFEIEPYKRDEKPECKPLKVRQARLCPTLNEIEIKSGDYRRKAASTLKPIDIRLGLEEWTFPPKEREP